MLGATSEEIDRFWDVFIRPALNLPTREAGADYGVFTVQTALLAGARAADLLLPVEPLGEMHGAAAGRALADRVRLESRVDALDELDADAIIIAVPPPEAAPSARHGAHRRSRIRRSSASTCCSTGRSSGTGWRPCSTRPPTGCSTAARSTRHCASGGGQYLTVVSSGAPDLLEIRGRELVDLMADALPRDSARPELLWSRVSREPRTTFAARPGTRRLRWTMRTTRPNVVLAGAWVASDWPATMESAVRSGVAAARALTA